MTGEGGEESLGFRLGIVRLGVVRHRGADGVGVIGGVRAVVDLVVGAVAAEDVRHIAIAVPLLRDHEIALAIV
jgi:hypothetical protein